MLLTVSYSVFTGIISESYLTCSPIRITFFYQFGGDAHLLILNEELKIAAHIYSRDLGGCTVDVRV